MKKPLIITSGVKNWIEKNKVPNKTLSSNVFKEYDLQPDAQFDGGNDKDFFTLVLFGQKFFVAKNEINGLTIMLPEEY